MKVLLITKNFPPLFGGASMVYGQLCKHFGPDMFVLTQDMSWQMVTGKFRKFCYEVIQNYYS